MKFISFLKWLRWFFGFGPKQEKKVEEKKVEPILVPTESYKVEHKKHYEARDILIEKLEQAKLNNIKIKNDNFDEQLNQLKRDVDRRYPRHVEPTPTKPNDTFLESMAIGYMTDSTVEGTILGGALNTSDETPKFEDGFGGGDFSGGGAGADYSDNTPSYDPPSYEAPSTPSYESPSYESPRYDPPSYDSGSSNYDSGSSFDDSSSRNSDY